ncbi:DUF6268 family outer membrane beta-barrel protein [Sinomicrobium pectinilyticum]|nr:DUF6268 family outer membrane beta-barrel protein [Sinomicrobium pectinilyticum]
MKKFIAVALLTGFNLGYAQQEDGLSVSSTLLPENAGTHMLKSGFSFQNTFPTSKKGNALVIGASYTHSTFSFEKRSHPFSTSSLERFHTASLKTGWIKTFNNRWKLMTVVEPGISSNLNGNLQFRDFSLTAYTVAILSGKDLTSFFLFGMAYDLQLGFPIGVISYYKIIDKKWSYHLGVPSTYINYNINRKIALQPFIKLDWTLANITKAILPGQENKKNRLSHIAVVGGLGYHHRIGKYFSLFAEGGYTIFNEMQIQNYKLDDNALYNFDLENMLYFNIGLKYNLD